MKRFFHVALRTLDVAAARAFYRAVLGEAAGVGCDAVVLHENAIANGARPHWLGFIDVGDVVATTEAFVARGASVRGPKWIDPRGLEAQVAFDPGGAIVALAKPPAGGLPPPAIDVAFQVLNTNDLAGIRATYGELLGWEIGDAEDLPEIGRFHPFAYEAGGPRTGAIGEIANRPALHPHWLFHFRVPDLDRAVAAVRANGGLVAAQVAVPSAMGGGRVAVCDDSLGAAFAITDAAAR